MGLIACGAGAILLGCEFSTGDCAGEGVDPVRAIIVDSVSGAPLAYRSSLIIRDGSFVDSVPFQGRAADSATYPFIEAGNSRAGIYDVTVRRQGARVWTRRSVRAYREDGCRLDQAELTVRLQPSG